MSEPQFPAIQHSLMVNGEQIVFRANNGQDLADYVESYQKNSGAIVENVAAIKQLMIAKGVFTSDVAPAQTAAATAASSSGAPTCVHGTYNDMQGKKTKAGNDYKFRYFCPKWSDECRPSNG